MVAEGNGGTPFRPSAFGLAASTYEMMITHMTNTTTDINDGNAVAAPVSTLCAWPYSAGSGIIDRKLAANIRAWALTHMSEAELHSYSQRQLLSMYLEQHIRPTLETVAPWMRTGSEGPEGAQLSASCPA